MCASFRTLRELLVATELSADVRQQLESALRETYFRGWKASFFSTAAFSRDLDDHVFRRYSECERHLVPWMARAGTLAGASVVEIGCGTGSSTAALAPNVAHIQAYDIAPASVDAAQRRLAILGLSERAACYCVEPQCLLTTMVAKAPAVTTSGGCSRPGVDIVLIYAVLEHQTVPERLETLSACWDLLRPGGMLVVADTPNRLIYWDAHTSELPFFHMLPDSVALPYASRSPRAGLRESIADVLPKGEARAAEVLARWGRGVSYHEFELALGGLTNLVVLDGFAPEMLEWLGLSVEEQLLIDYWKRKPIPVPIGFARKTIDVILRKPEGDAEA